MLTTFHAPWPDVRPRKKTSGSQVTGSLPKNRRGGCFQGTKYRIPADVINNAGLQQESAWIDCSNKCQSFSCGQSIKSIVWQQLEPGTNWEFLILLLFLLFRSCSSSSSSSSCCCCCYLLSFRDKHFITTWLAQRPMKSRPGCCAPHHCGLTLEPCAICCMDKAPAPLVPMGNLLIYHGNT